MNRTSSSEEALRERIAQTWDSPIYCSHSSAFQQQKEDSTRRRLWYKVFGLNPPSEAEVQEVLKMMQVFYKQNRNIENDCGVNLTNHGFTSRKSENFTNFLKIYDLSLLYIFVAPLYSRYFWFIPSFFERTTSVCLMIIAVPLVIYFFFLRYPTTTFFPWFST